MKKNRTIYNVEELKQASPLALSFVGDAVHTLFVREYFFNEQPYDNNELHRLSAGECCAKNQAKITKVFSNLLNEDELFIFKKGKNAKVNSIPKNASLMEYKLATGFEAVIGYLYLAGKDERLEELFKLLYANKASESVNLGL